MPNRQTGCAAATLALALAVSALAPPPASARPVNARPGCPQYTLFDGDYTIVLHSDAPGSHDLTAAANLHGCLTPRTLKFADAGGGAHDVTLVKLKGQMATGAQTVDLDLSVNPGEMSEVGTFVAHQGNAVLHGTVTMNYIVGGGSPSTMNGRWEEVTNWFAGQSYTPAPVMPSGTVQAPPANGMKLPAQTAH